MQMNYVWAHLADDDVPQRPNPADDALSSAQARRYWRLSDAERASLNASLVQMNNVASC